MGIASPGSHLSQAPGSGEVDTIFIGVAGTIVLEHGALPEITGNVEIVGSLTPTAAPTIDANGRARPFFIGRPGDVTLKRLTIINGKAPNGSY